MKKLSVILPIFIGLAGLVTAHAGEDEFAHHETSGCMGNWMYGGVGMGFFGWIFAVLVIVALILLIFWLIKQVQKK